MKKFTNVMNIMFIAAVIENLIELNITRGMFTWIISAGFLCMVSVITIITNLINKVWLIVCLQALLMFSLLSYYAELL